MLSQKVSRKISYHKFAVSTNMQNFSFKWCKQIFIGEIKSIKVKHERRKTYCIYHSNYRSALHMYTFFLKRIFEMLFSSVEQIKKDWNGQLSCQGGTCIPNGSTTWLRIITSPVRCRYGTRPRLIFLTTEWVCAFPHEISLQMRPAISNHVPSHYTMVAANVLWVFSQGHLIIIFIFPSKQNEEN